MKSIPSGVLAGLESGRFSVRQMLKASLGSGDHGIWNDAYDVAYGGVTYKPLAGNMQCDPIPGSGELKADQMRVTLTGLSTDALALMAGDDWHQRPCVVYDAYVDDASLILHVEPAFVGFIDQIEQTDQAGDVSTLVVMLESPSRELDRGSDRVYSDSDQRAHGSATDTFLAQMATSNANTDIYWGQAAPPKTKKV